MRNLQANGWLLLLCMLYACQEKSNLTPQKVFGYRPIYTNDTSIFTVKNMAARRVVNAGKIYAKDNFIFQNEIGAGIHLIDNSDPSNSSRIGFIKVDGSEEISIKGNYLYTNNYSDLVVIDISNINNVREVNRIKGAFNGNQQQHMPPGRGYYFECADARKGVITSWVLDSIVQPKCRN